MKKLLLAAAALAFTASSAHAMLMSPIFLGAEDVDGGTICVIDDVTVLAANAEDCTKIGGEATHTLKHDFTEVE